MNADTRRLLIDPSDPGDRRPYADRSIADNFEQLEADAQVDNTEYLAYRYMQWGPTADNVTMFLFQEDGTAYLPFMFHRQNHHKPAELGRTFVAELPLWDLTRVLYEAAWHIVSDHSDRMIWGPPRR